MSEDQDGKQKEFNRKAIEVLNNIRRDIHELRKLELLKESNDQIKGDKNIGGLIGLLDKLMDEIDFNDKKDITKEE